MDDALRLCLKSSSRPALRFLRLLILSLILDTRRGGVSQCVPCNMQSEYFRVYENLISDKFKSRVDGLQTLRRLVLNPATTVTHDKTYHKMIEGVFQVVLKEKQLYVRSNGVKAGQIVERMSLAASVFRTLVEQGVEIFRAKTFNALTNHIVQVSMHNDEFMDPIALDYLKALKALCAYPPHVEHLSMDDWTDLASYLAAGIALQIQAAEKEQTRRLRSAALELVACLENMMAATNAPIAKCARFVYTSLRELLLFVTVESGIHRNVFWCVNKILSYVIVNDRALYAEMVTDLIPIVASLWNGKTSAMKEQLIATIAYIYPGAQTLPSEKIDEPMRNLVYVIFMEYRSRLQRDLLQIDDITLAPGGTTAWLSTSQFYLSSEKGITPWMILMILARCNDFIDPESYESVTTVNYVSPVSDITRKRRRLIDSDSDTSPEDSGSTTNIDQLFSKLRSASESHELALLQLISFILHLDRRNQNVQNYVSSLNAFAASDNSNIASWAMVSLAALTASEDARNREVESEWFESWELCTRRMASHGTCQASCHLLRHLLSSGVVPYSRVAGIIDSLIPSVETIGPVIVCDSSLGFWETCLSARQLASPKQTVDAADRIVKWLFGRIIAGGTSWRRFGRIFRNTNICSVANFILRCCGLHVLPSPRRSLLCKLESGIVEFLHQLEYDKDVISYMVLIGKLYPADCRAVEDNNTFVGQYATQVEDTIMESMAMMLADYLAAAETNPSSEVIENQFDTALLALLIDSRIGKLDRHQRSEISPLQKLVRDMADRIQNSDSKSEFASMVVHSLASIDGSMDFRTAANSLAELFRPICIALEARLYTSPNSPEAGNTPVTTDTDFDRISNKSKQHIVDPGDVPRKWNASSFEWTARTFSTVTRLWLQIVMASSRDPQTDILKRFKQVPVYVFSVNLPELLEVMTTEFIPNGNIRAIEMLYRLIGSRLLPRYEYERSEPTVVFCAKALSASAHLWVPSTSDHGLRTVATDIYKWTVRLALDKMTMSYFVRWNLAVLLLDIQRLDQNFRVEADMPSPRAYFLQLLRDPDCRVRYKLATLMPDFVKEYSVTDHAAVYADIHESLDNSSEHTEGMIVRSLTISKLLSTSPAMVRSAVFNLVEMAEFPEIEDYVAYCFRTAAMEQGLTDPRTLFDIFSPQIIYTRFEMNESFDDFTFRIFGYKSRKEFFESNYEEYVAQLVTSLRPGILSEIDELAQLIGMRSSKVVLESLARIMAYACSGFLNDKQKTTRVHEVLKTFFTAKELSEACRSRVSTASAILLNIMDVRRICAEDFQSAGLEDAAKKWTDLNRYSVAVELADRNQPSYDPQRTFAAIQRLGDFGNFDMRAQEAKNPVGSFVYITRMILDMLSKCTNGIQQCRVIKALKVHIALKDMTAKRYPARMILHAVIPLVTVLECTSDILDIVHTLLRSPGLVDTDRGAATPQVWRENLLARFVLEISFYLRKLQKRPGLSAFVPKELISQFKADVAATILKLASRNKFIAQHLRWLQSVVVYDTSDENAIPAWTKREIALVVLDKDKVFGDSGRKYALKLLGLELGRSDTSSDRMLSHDEDCKEIVPSLLRICKEQEVPEDFTVWAARTCGRAYASSGIVPTQWYDDMPINPTENAALAHEDQYQIFSIVSCILDLLDSDDFAVVRLAEATLRRIFLYLSDQHDMQHALPDHIVEAVLFDETDVSLGRESTTQQSELPTDMKFDAWARRIATTICSVLQTPHRAFYANLPVVINAVDGFAAKILPHLLHEYVLNKMRSKEVTSIFNDCFRSVSDDTVEHASLLIRAFIYLQNQPFIPNQNQLLRFRCIEGLDYLAFLNAALVCKMYSAAFLILECVWSTGVSEEILCKHLVQIYQGIDDPDALYGVPTEPTLQSIIDFSEFEHDGWKSLSYRGAMLDNDIHTASRDPANILGVFNAFSNLGLNGLSMGISNSDFLGMNASEQLYETSWKLGQWHIPVVSHATSRHSVIYEVLQKVNKAAMDPVLADRLKADDLMRDSSIAIFKGLSSSLNTAHSIREAMYSFSILTEAWEIWSVKLPNDIYHILDKFDNRMKWIEETRFAYSEDILLARQMMFNALSRINLDIFENKRTDFWAAETISLKNMTSAARRHGELQKALSFCVKFDNLAESSFGDKNAILLARVMETSNVLWAKGERAVAIKMLKSLVGADNGRSSFDALQVAPTTVLATLAQWISAARQERPDDILTNYLDPAVEKTTTFVGEGTLKSQVYHQYAVFCDGQLRNESTLEDFSRVDRMRADKMIEKSRLQAMIKSAQSENQKKVCISHLAKVEKMLAIDDAEYQRLVSNRQTFLANSITFYLMSLAASDEFDEDSFRFCSLWLANSADDIANKATETLIDTIPTAKMVNWINQLSSRLLYEDTRFQKVLQKLVSKICRLHPYHSLYQISALTMTKSGGRGASARNAVIRAKAGIDIWSSLKSTHSYWSHYLRPVEEFCGKAIPLSKFQVKNRNGYKPEMLPDRSWWDRAIHDLQLPPPTMSIPVRPDCDYSTVPKMVSVDKDVSLAAGINMPKIVRAKADDGRTYTMLMKGGNDDLRQDAIMEQVFEQVNSFLRKNESTKQRNMHVRTYKVIPLNPSSGIIEFVQHTVAFLNAVQPLHEAYYPDDWSHTKARSHIRAALEKKDWTVADRVRAYREVVKHVRPALRFFFLERFRTPHEWVQSKTIYTRGTAAMSILGYVLGLGDRHCNNILLDTSTGEPVHIDLGIAFEQGRLLPIPETVPFRLTRDVVDGMGISGTEGVFRRCCEFMLDVLRQEAENIMTVLEVLKYDPLYSWTISPLRMKRFEETEDTDPLSKQVTPSPKGDGSEADRALLGTSQKLSKTLSVDAVVNQLIQQASDPHNLALLYFGWTAFY
ncbi:hypothetical protein V1525DRAFT_430371 [Lipomyces kononenkoae]|uniref:Uncharacterized protein n=1 Tax=Lipomyces kononenkoae TaxID=34357 RepID=A0ACC3T8N0_LIPKO